MDTRRIKELVGSRIFTATFRKKDGTLRTMNCRLGVTRHLRGGSLSYNPEERNNLVVYDLQKAAYRTINLDTLININANGRSFMADQQQGGFKRISEGE